MNTIREYKDFIKDYFEYNAWKTDSSFPILKTDDDSIEKLKNFKIIEFIAEGFESLRNKSFMESKLEGFKRGMVYELFRIERQNIFLFATEHKPLRRSKLRSHKGILDKKQINQEDYLQFEKTLQDDNTVLSFISKVNSSNFDYLLDFFFDDANSFIVKTDNDYINEDSISDIFSCIEFDELAQINYLKLILLFGERGDYIYRIGGDSGNSYWSLQRFCKCEE